MITDVVAAAIINTSTVITVTIVVVLLLRFISMLKLSSAHGDMQAMWADLAIRQHARALLSPVPCPATLEAHMVGVLVPLQVVCPIPSLRQKPAMHIQYSFA